MFAFLTLLSFNVNFNLKCSYLWRFLQRLSVQFGSIIDDYFLIGLRGGRVIPSQENFKLIEGSYSDAGVVKVTEHNSWDGDIFTSDYRIWKIQRDEEWLENT